MMTNIFRFVAWVNGQLDTFRGKKQRKALFLPCREGNKLQKIGFKKKKKS